MIDVGKLIEEGWNAPTKLFVCRKCKEPLVRKQREGQPDWHEHSEFLEPALCCPNGCIKDTCHVCIGRNGQDSERVEQR